MKRKKDRRRPLPRRLGAMSYALAAAEKNISFAAEKAEEIKCRLS
jgi:hypothetical protein